jgi:anti-anti-sigma regulatory factor
MLATRRSQVPQETPAAPATAVESLAKQPFRCRWRADQLGAAWIEVTGDIDRASVPSLARALYQAQASACLVVVDLRGATLLDAAGGRVIGDAGSRAQRHGHQVVVAQSYDQPDVSLALADAPHVQACRLHAGEPSVQALLQLAANARRVVSAA